MVVKFASQARREYSAATLKSTAAASAVNESLSHAGRAAPKDPAGAARRQHTLSRALAQALM